MNSTPSAGVPAGFAAVHMGGEFMRLNGPLYLRKAEGRVWMGFRVEARHCNPAQICHGGMMASFCDMLLPVCATHLAPTSIGAWVQGEAQLLRHTPVLVFLQGLVTADELPVARASGIFRVGPVLAEHADQA